MALFLALNGFLDYSPLRRRCRCTTILVVSARPNEQVLVRVRRYTLRNGVGLAVHGSYRILGC